MNAHNRSFGGKPWLHLLVEGGVIAALYTALTMLIPAASFGPVQFRLSEALTILPVFTAAAVPGLTVGCFLSNLLGLATGANLAGAWDLLFGTGATLLGALLTYLLRNIRWRHLPVPATLPPVLLNAAVVGLELTVVLLGGFSWPVYGVTALYVGLAQLAACTVCGLALYAALEKSGVFRRNFMN